MKSTLFYNILGVAFSALAATGLADVAPNQVKCTVKSVTPANAAFFSFSRPIPAGDTTTLDLAADEIKGITFASGAHIGSTVTPHPLIKQKLEFEGLTVYQADFISHTNRQHYLARLVATEEDKTKPLQVSLDVLEDQTLGRLVLNSLELECSR